MLRISFGFSLMEMMITLTLGVILLSLAAPAFTDMTRNNRRAAAVTRLVADIQYARTTAISEGREIVLCPSSDAASCQRQWNTGWIVFLNADADQPPVRDPDERVLRSTTALEPGLTLNANRDAFEFRPFISSTNGTFVICDARGPEHGTAIVVSIVGRTRLQKKTMPDGAPLDCAES